MSAIDMGIPYGFGREEGEYSREYSRDYSRDRYSKERTANTNKGEKTASWTKSSDDQMRRMNMKYASKNNNDAKKHLQKQAQTVFEKMQDPKSEFSFKAHGHLYQFKKKHLEDKADGIHMLKDNVEIGDNEFVQAARDMERDIRYERGDVLERGKQAMMVSFSDAKADQVLQQVNEAFEKRGDNGPIVVRSETPDGAQRPGGLGREEGISLGSLFNGHEAMFYKKKATGKDGETKDVLKMNLDGKVYEGDALREKLKGLQMERYEEIDQGKTMQEAKWRFRQELSRAPIAGTRLASRKIRRELEHSAQSGERIVHGIGGHAMRVLERGVSMGH